jgi:hypothetical protein
MSRLLQGTSRLLQVDRTSLLQGLLQFVLTLTCPHGLNTACWLLKATSTCLQGFFSWIHGFNSSLLGFMASRILHLASWLHYSNNLKDSLLSFMVSRIIYLDSWIQGLFTWLHGFNTQTISLFHCHIIIITITSLSLLPHYHYHFHFDTNDNIF